MATILHQISFSPDILAASNARFPTTLPRHSCKLTAIAAITIFVSYNRVYAHFIQIITNIRHFKRDSRDNCSRARFTFYGSNNRTRNTERFKRDTPAKIVFTNATTVHGFESRPKKSCDSRAPSTSGANFTRYVTQRRNVIPNVSQILNMTKTVNWEQCKLRS